MPILAHSSMLTEDGNSHWTIKNYIFLNMHTAAILHINTCTLSINLRLFTFMPCESTPLPACLPTALPWEVTQSSPTIHLSIHLAKMPWSWPRLGPHCLRHLRLHLTSDLADASVSSWSCGLASTPCSKKSGILCIFD